MLILLLMQDRMSNPDPDSINWTNLCLNLFDATEFNIDISIQQNGEMKGLRSCIQNLQEIFYNFNTESIADINLCMSILIHCPITVNVIINRGGNRLCQRMYNRATRDMSYDF